LLARGGEASDLPDCIRLTTGTPFSKLRRVRAT